MMQAEAETVEYLRKMLDSALPWEREEIEESLRKSEQNLEMARELVR
jgi:hypothetical protein